MRFVIGGCALKIDPRGGLGKSLCGRLSPQRPRCFPAGKGWAWPGGHPDPDTWSLT